MGGGVEFVSETGADGEKGGRWMKFLGVKPDDGGKETGHWYAANFENQNHRQSRGYEEGPYKGPLG